MTNNFFQIAELGDGSAKLTINLQPYLDALNLNLNVEEVYQQYADRLTGLNSQLLWNDLLTAALEGHQELQPFLDTTLFEILEENGCELIKNSMDEVLFRCLEDPLSPAIVEITATVERDQQFKVSVKDNGNGFPSTFLEHFNSDEHIFNYLNSRQSHRKKEQHDQWDGFHSSLSKLSIQSLDETTDESSLSSRSASPNSLDSSPRVSPLTVRSFGGHGIGIRNLVSRILTGLPIQTLRLDVQDSGVDSFIIKKYQGANIELYNQGGACLEMTMPDTLQLNTSLTALSMFKPDAPEVTLVLPSKFGKKK